MRGAAGVRRLHTFVAMRLHTALRSDPAAPGALGALALGASRGYTSAKLAAARCQPLRRSALMSAPRASRTRSRVASASWA